MAWPCREAGVRSLKQLLEKTYRKVALKLVKEGLSGPTPSNIQEGPAHPGDTVAEHGGVGLGDAEAPQQAPPDATSSTEASGKLCIVQHVARGCSRYNMLVSL